MFDAEVAVIGAGAAGLAAFERLRTQGCDALLFEARARIGGRIFDDFPTGWPMPVPLGAEFIHGGPPELAGLEDEAGGVAALKGWVSTPQGLQPASEDAFGEAAEEVFARMSSVTPPAADCSFSQWLARSGDIPEAARARARNFVEGFEAADPDRISVYSLNRERQADGDPKSSEPRRPRGGYGTLLGRLSAGLRQSPPEKVLLATPVRRIDWRPGEVEVSAQAANGMRLWRVRRAILTLPLSLLRQSLDPAPDGLQFQPRLEAKRAALEQLEMGPARRVTLRLRAPVWAQARDRAGADLAPLGFLFGTEPELIFRVWWTAPGSATGAAQITGWTGGPRALGLTGLARERIEQQAIADLSRLLHLPPAAVREPLLGVHSHDWQRDPWSLGAYSYAKVGGMNAPGELAAPLEDTLYFAGEATENTGEHATVQGAIRSGRRAAVEVLHA